MSRLLVMLALCVGVALAQEGKDDEGISIDETPSGPEEPEKAPEKAASKTPRTPGQKPATVVLRKKVFSLALPADWVLEETDEPKAELAWDVRLPGSTSRAGLAVRRDESGVDTRAAPYYEAEWVRKENPDQKTEVRTKPPRIVIRRSANGADWVDEIIFLSVRNNPYRLVLSCAAADFDEAEGDMVNAARSFTADVELWPPIPKGYETSQEGTWLVARAPSVTAPLAPLVKVLKDVEKRFRRDHGPLPKSDAPIIVLVHASKEEAAKMEPKAAENDGFLADPRRRLFAIPLPKGDRNQASAAAFSAQRALFLAKYGDWRPEWLEFGECSVAQAESYTDKPLPALDEGFVGWASTLKLHRLDQLEALHGSDAESWRRESFFYVAALREGKYRKRYSAFLDDFAETGDGPGAFERHLASIDQDDLIASTNQFISTRIKPEKRQK